MLDDTLSYFRHSITSSLILSFSHTTGHPMHRHSIGPNRTKTAVMVKVGSAMQGKEGNAEERAKRAVRVVVERAERPCPLCRE